MAWELSAKSDQGLKLEMHLKDDDGSLWDTVSLLIKNCTNAVAKLEITIKKV